MSRIKIFRIHKHDLIGAILLVLEKSKSLRTNSMIMELDWNWRAQSLEVVVRDSHFKSVEDGMEPPIEIVGRKK